MKHYLVFAGCMMFMQQSQAQKSIEAVVNAETSFAAASVRNGTKAAFLQFLDSAGIVFDKGMPVNGIAFWNSKEKSTGILNWHPQYADIGWSNDFGFTTGQWTWQAGSLEDTIGARGYYTTIWHIDRNIEWKFIVDLGVGNSPCCTDTASWWDLRNWKTDNTHYHGSPGLLIKAEKKFIRRTEKPFSRGWERKEWYRRNYAGVFILYRNGRFPALDHDSFLGVMNLMPEKIKYKILGSGMASSGDIGYVYGTALINGKTENYLRIWRMEKAGWKIELEVLRY